MSPDRSDYYAGTPLSDYPQHVMPFTDEHPIPFHPEDGQPKVEPPRWFVGLYYVAIAFLAYWLFNVLAAAAAALGAWGSR